MDRTALRRLAVVALTLAVAGCASSPGADRPRSIAIRLEEDAAQEANDRMVLKRLLGRDSASIGGLMARAVADELDADGTEVSTAPAAATREAALAACGSEGLLVVHVGAWDLDTVAASGHVTVEYDLRLLRASDGSETWSHAVPRRTVALRTGESRDIDAFVRRLTVEALRSLP